MRRIERSWWSCPDGRVIARAPQNDADLLNGSEQEQLATRLVEAWTADMSFALDRLNALNASDPSGRFTGRLDLQKVPGVFGHSLGGATPSSSATTIPPVSRQASAMQQRPASARSSPLESPSHSCSC